MSIDENIDIQTKKFYRAKNLAVILGIGLSTVWKYSKEGKIKAYKISGGVTLFNLEEVEKALFGNVNNDVKTA